jgi:predicted nucleotidyltransferase
MEKNNLISYALSFVSFLLDDKIAVYIDNIVLFGSVARGDFDEESDIDIFVDTRKEIEKDVTRALNLFRISEMNRKWELKGIKNEISVKVGKLEKWSLARDVISNGIILYGKYKKSPENVKYYAMVIMDFRSMNRSKKLRLWRKMYGHKQRVGEKIYQSKGMVNELGGKKIEKSIILIPMENVKKITDFMNKNKIDYTMYEIWSDSL